MAKLPLDGVKILDLARLDGEHGGITGRPQVRLTRHRRDHAAHGPRRFYILNTGVSTRRALAPARDSLTARGLVVQLVETMGCLRRDAVAAQIAALTSGDRRLLAQCRVRLGFAHVFIDQLLRPEPTRWRLALWAVAQRSALGLDALPPPPAPGRVTIDVGADVVPGFYDVAGFMSVGAQAVRIDMVDRLARAVHGIRDGRAPFVPDATWVASIGLRPDGFVRLMRGLGYRLDPDAAP